MSKMREKLRKISLDIIGEVPWGTHFCQFYQSRQDLIEILVPYFKQGLEDNEFCMWITSEPLGVEDAKAALKVKVKDLDAYIQKGQIEILDYSQWYTKTGRFDADKVLAGWVEKEKQAIERGFDGLRLTGNTFWLEKKDWENFTGYEAMVDSVIGKHRMLALCSYFLDKCQVSEVIDVVSNHQFALIRKEGKWASLESSERRKAQDKLQISEIKFRTLVEHIPNKVFIKNKDSVYIFCNKNYADDLKIEPEKIVGKTDYDFYYKELAEKYRSDDKRIIETGETEDIEEKYIEDGQDRWVHTVKTPYKDEKGKTIGVLGIFRDITERKKAEESLRLTQLSVDIAADAVVWLRPDGSLSYVNDATCRELGYSREELLRMAVYDIDPAFQREVWLAHWEELKQKKSLRFESTHRKKDGRIASLEIISSYLKFGDNEYICSSARDITERKKAENSRELVTRILQYLSESGEWVSIIRKILKSIQEYSELEVAALRLREGDDYPYFVQYGFTDEFVQAENYLCERNKAGDLVRDYTGNPVLDCMCGNIIRGRTDPKLPFFTQGGSFWSNCTTELLANTTEKERQGRTRNRCNGEGYESVALIPIRAGIEIIGLLQLNDRRKNCFSLELIRLFEGIAVSIGSALERRKALEEVLALSKFPSENPNPILRIAKDGEILYSNKAGLELLAHWNVKIGEKAPEKWRRLIKETLESAKPGLQEEEEVNDKIFSVVIAPVVEAGYVNLYARDITERKKAQEEIKNLAKFPEENLNPVYRVSKNGVLLYANPASRRQVLEDQTKIGDKIPKKWIGMIRSAYDFGKKQQTEIELSGRVFLFDLVPVIEGGYVNSYATDITERKKAQEALQETTSYLENLFDYANAPIIVWNPSFKITRFNHAFERLTGYAAKEIIGQKLTVLFPKASKDKSLVEIEHTLKGEYWKTVEIPILCKDRSIRVALWNSANIYGKDGKTLIATIAQGIDISERKKVQARLWQSEERYRTLAESSTDPIFVQDREGRYIYVNQAGARNFGKQTSDIIGKKMRIFFTKKEEKESLDSIRLVFRKKKSIVIERILKVRGEVCTFLVTIAPILDSKGDVAAVVSVAHDITELKKTEKELVEAKADLEEEKLALERKNIALREIIEQVEIEKNKIKGDVVTNVNELTIPILKKLRAKGVTRKYMDLLDNRLGKLTSSLGRELTDSILKLTSKEIEICNMIEGGLASKEIADFLSVSYQTVEKHRKNIRKKLGLGHKKINLATYLQKKAKAKA